MEGSTDNILLFDGVCNLCNGLVRFIIKRDKKGKFKFASLQSEAGRSLLERFGLPQNEIQSLVLIQNDKYYLKSTAALKVLRELGGFWSTFYIFIWLPQFFRDFIYDIVAKSRYRIFGKLDTCMIPTAELQSRFLQ
jgi:predicted DCC family thiol-disulfide oxidoreductase YuxK